jgi:hypothetical protein
VKKTLIAVVLTSALILAIAASAWGRGSFSDNQYQGHAERDPGTFVGFDLEKHDGKTKVTRVQALLRFNCVGSSGGQGLVAGKGSLPVKSNGSFSGSLRGKFMGGRGVPPPTSTLKISGKLQKHGKAKGKIASTIQFQSQMRGGPSHCYTGEVDWKAKKGAVVNPVFEARSR